MNDLSPRELLDRLFRRWYLIALAVLLGGMAGWLASYTLSPIYEAHAEIFIDLDSDLWAQEEHVGNPVEIALANSLRPVTSLFYADETILDLVAAAQEENIPLDKGKVMGTFTIQRANMTWLMSVRSRNPQYAARLADLWVQVALPIHQRAHEHAVSAYAFTLQRDVLFACFADATLAAGNACAGTNFVSLLDLQPALAHLDAQIADERKSSFNLDPAINVFPGPPAVVPMQPVRYRRAWLALAGALVGLIMGIIASQITFPVRKESVRAR